MTDTIRTAAETLISMSTQYLMGSYDEELYAKMVMMFADKMKSTLEVPNESN
jgi:hypothetical protein